MPNFPRRRTLPMQPSSYRAAARKLRKWADALEATADADTPQCKRHRTMTVTRLAEYAKHLAWRHTR